MGYSRKISRIGKTKKEKEAAKLIKTTDKEIQKQSQKSHAKVKPAKASNQKPEKKKHQTDKASAKSKYVTQGMVDYVTLLRSRKSGHKLRGELMDTE